MKNKSHPKTIKIFEQTYSIEFDNNFCEKLDALGTSSSNLQQIKLSDTWEHEKLPNERIFKTLCHEIAHALLWEIGQDELSKDETFVDNLGCVLCSFLEQNCDWEK